MTALAIPCVFEVTHEGRAIATHEGFILHWPANDRNLVIVADATTGELHEMPLRKVRMVVGAQKEDHH